MPWEIILVAVVPILCLVLAARLWQLRGPRSRTGRYPDVGQPPEGAEPMIEPRLQDIGSGSYELPLSDPETETDRSSG